MNKSVIGLAILMVVLLSVPAFALDPSEVLDITTTDFVSGGQIKSGTFLTMIAELEAWANDNGDSEWTFNFFGAQSVNTGHLATGVFTALGVPIGGIIPYAGGTADTDWLICNGQTVSRTTYSSLYAVIGDSYGAGDGITTFQIPNLSGRTVAGPRPSASSEGAIRDLGDTSATCDTHVQTIAEMAAHTHSTGVQRNSTTLGSDSFRSMSETGSTGSTGNSQAMDFRQPTIYLNYIIYCGNL